jgi:Putative transmembrane protein (PGPGW)
VEQAPQKRSRRRRALRFGAGTGLVAVGVPLLVLPGPGLLAVAGGLYLMSEEIPALRRPLDAVEARLRAAKERR